MASQFTEPDFTDLGSIGDSAQMVYRKLAEYGDLGATTNQLKEDLEVSYNTVRTAILTMLRREWVAPIWKDRVKHRDTKYHVLSAVNTKMPFIANPNSKAKKKFVSVTAFWEVTKWMIENDKEQLWMRSPHHKLAYAACLLFRAAANAQYAVDAKIPESQRELRKRFVDDQRLAHEHLQEVIKDCYALIASAESMIDNPKFWTEAPKQMADLLINDPAESAEDNHELIVQEFNVIQEFFENFKPHFDLEKPRYNIQYKQNATPVGHFEVKSVNADDDDLFTLAQE